VHVLLNAGANLEVRDEKGFTAPMLATPTLKVLRALVDAGADLEVQHSDGATALMFAAQRNPSGEVVQALLSAGANPMARDTHGRRAIDFAQDSKDLVGTDTYLRHMEASFA
jgi:uncharacterized protein